MSVFIDSVEYPRYSGFYPHPETGEDLTLISKRVRRNRLICEMQTDDGYLEYLIFPI
jgi:hypothetical protein